MDLPKAIFELEYNHGSIYGAEEEQAVLEVLRASAPSCGAKVKAFEDAFAAYSGAKYGLAVTSATTGLELAMVAAGVGPGDEVITTPISWISTANAPAMRGASVVFADVDPVTLNIDPATVANKITDRTKAILVVHMYGHCCDMDALTKIAAERGILLVTDCAHAAGAEYRGSRAATLGDIAVFSFHQQKNMATLGEGGMVLTDRRDLYERMLSFRSLCALTYDPKGKYLPIDESVTPMGKRYWYLDFDDVGTNFRMTDMQAAVGLVQLGRLESLNARRAEIARIYTERLAGIPGLTLPTASPDVKHTWHVYCVMTEESFPLTKEDFMWELYVNRRIKVWSHYMPMHLTTAYRRLGHHEGECPVAERMYHRYVSLPIHPRLTTEAIDYLIASVRAVAG
jgi:dTDP-4-amino-4,6-dideoxygalactose transaminase